MQRFNKLWPTAGFASGCELLSAAQFGRGANIVQPRQICVGTKPNIKQPTARVPRIYMLETTPFARTRPHCSDSAQPVPMDFTMAPKVIVIAEW